MFYAWKIWNNNFFCRYIQDQRLNYSAKVVTKKTWKVLPLRDNVPYCERFCYVRSISNKNKRYLHWYVSHICGKKCDNNKITLSPCLGLFVDILKTRCASSISYHDLPDFKRKYLGLDLIENLFIGR